MLLRVTGTQPLLSYSIIKSPCCFRADATTQTITTRLLENTWANRASKIFTQRDSSWKKISKTANTYHNWKRFSDLKEKLSTHWYLQKHSSTWHCLSMQSGTLSDYARIKILPSAVNSLAKIFGKVSSLIRSKCFRVKAFGHYHPGPNCPVLLGLPCAAFKHKQYKACALHYLVKGRRNTFTI